MVLLPSLYVSLSFLGSCCRTHLRAHLLIAPLLKFTSSPITHRQIFIVHLTVLLSVVFFVFFFVLVIPLFLHAPCLVCDPVFLCTRSPAPGQHATTPGPDPLLHFNSPALTPQPPPHPLLSFPGPSLYAMPWTPHPYFCTQCLPPWSAETLIVTALLHLPSFPIKHALICLQPTACLPVMDSIVATQMNEATFEKLFADVIYIGSKIFIQASL